MRPRVRNQLILSFVFIIFSYIAICFYTYFMQERFLFQYYYFNEKYNFDYPFEEMEFKTSEDVVVNGILFNNKDSRKLVIINRGSGGELQNYSPKESPLYSELNYSIFIYDYRGNGKSKGKSEDMNSLFQDFRIIYNHFKDIYGEENIVVLGNSFGTGIAAKIASEYNPKCLILKAPYYEYNELLKRRSGWMPLKIINKYNFKTYQYLESCSCPVVLVHGAKDKAISHKASERLFEHIKSEKHLLVIEEAGHSDIQEFKEYEEQLKEILD
jgi:alpha-beta hydrolase superfamily lysophospholipase